MRRRTIFLAALLLASALPALAQDATKVDSAVQFAATSATGTTCSNTKIADTGCQGLNVAMMASVYIDLSCTNTPAFTAGRILIEGDEDQQTWAKNIGEIPLANCVTEEHLGPFITAGLTTVRVRLATAITGAGTVTISMRPTAWTPPKNGPASRNEIVTSAVLTSGLTYASRWYDTHMDDLRYVEASAYATTIGSAAAGFAIQSSDDTTNTSQTGTIGSPATVSAASRGITQGYIPDRFWRIAYVNGAGTQGAFTLAINAVTSPPVPLDAFRIPIIDIFQNTSSPFLTTSDAGAGGAILQCDQRANISVSSATTTSIVAVSGTKAIYVCGYTIDIQGVITTAGTGRLEFGTGAACVTTQDPFTAAYIGNLTAGVPTIINVGGALGYVAKSAASGVLCYVSTTSTAQLVTVVYAQK